MKHTEQPAAQPTKQSFDEEGFKKTFVELFDVIYPKGNPVDIAGFDHTQTEKAGIEVSSALNKKLLLN
jgi:hypothetical protein